uniref:BTB domain-containing protein n=1 Tax=Aegilops tauschii subsp. strangulata TaxID=200361 RepID=A0A453LGC8_AEGTS
HRRAGGGANSASGDWSAATPRGTLPARRSLMSFAGVSVVDSAKHCTCDTSAVYAGADSGYHLLMVRDYSRTKVQLPTGESATTGLFTVGEYDWYIEYYPNGENPNCRDFVSLYVTRHTLYDCEGEEDVEAKFSFSLVDQLEKHKPVYIHGTNKTCTFSSSAPSWGSDRFVRRDALERSAHLKGDCLTIRCDIMVVCKDHKIEDAAGTVPDINQHFGHLLQNKVGADVTFEVGGETFAAHRCVLAARSKVFMAQLFGPMKEGATTSSVIQIKDMEAKVFRALLSFIYTDSLPAMEKDSMEEDEMSEVMDEGREEAAEFEMWLQWLEDLFVAADRYDLQLLKLICEKQLSEHISVSSVTSTLALAEKHHCCGLKEACLKFIQVQSPSCLQTVMATSGWDHIAVTYPWVVKEFIAKLASNQRK